MTRDQRHLGFLLKIGGLASIGVALCVVPMDTVAHSCIGGVVALPCFAASDAALRLAPTLGVMVLGAAFVAVMALIAEAGLHLRLHSALSSVAEAGTIGGRPVSVVPTIPGGAFVAGFRRPTIYVAADLDKRLRPAELEAVLLHESHHQRTHAPIRLLLLGGVRRCFSWSESVSSWLNARRAEIEIRADSYAIQAGASRRDLARALVKLSALRPPIGAAGFASPEDRRIAALLGTEQISDVRRRPPFSLKCVVLAVPLFAALCTLLP